MREKPLKLRSSVCSDRFLEECHAEGALTDRRYKALTLKRYHLLTDADIGRQMGISRQGAAKLLAAGNDAMKRHLANRKIRDRIRRSEDA